MKTKHYCFDLDKGTVEKCTPSGTKIPPQENCIHEWMDWEEDYKSYDFNLFDNKIGGRFVQRRMCKKCKFVEYNRQEI